MKSIIIYSILCLLCFCGKLYGQKAMVTDAPDWFFTPEEGVYVGISLPGDDFDLAQQQAIYVALLSYALQNETQIHYRRILESYSGGGNNREQSKIEMTYRYTLCLPDRYRIIKTAGNRYGEVFVGIAVNNGIPPDKSITILVEGYDKTASKSGNGEQEYSGELTFVLKDTVPHYHFSMFATVETANDSLYAEVRTEWATAASSGKMDWDSGEDYSYGNHGENVLPVLSTFPLKTSLGGACLTALLTGIHEVCEVSTATDSITGASEQLSARINDDIIVKPANAIRVAIKDGHLYLLHDLERQPGKKEP
jgi:hypothetical protein